MQFAARQCPTALTLKGSVSVNTYLCNKYTRWYYNIIHRAQSRVTTEYTEKHHILPKSLGGSNDRTNLVRLTAREHFVCHLLLTKMCANHHNRYKMLYAFTAMAWIQNIGEGRYSLNSYQYEYARRCGRKAHLAWWTADRRQQHSEKLKHFAKTQDPNCVQEQQRREKIRQFQQTKTWAEKAVASRLENCLKNAAKSQGKKWTAKHRQRRQESYVKKNRARAEQIFALYDSGLNRRQIALKLGISWEAVKYPLLHREWFAPINTA